MNKETFNQLIEESLSILFRRIDHYRDLLAIVTYDSPEYIRYFDTRADLFRQVREIEQMR